MYDLSSVSLWDVVEMTLIIIIACLPSIPAVFRHPRIFSSWVSLQTWAGSFQNTNATLSQWTRTSRGVAQSSNQQTYHQLEEHSLSVLRGDAHGDNISANRCGIRHPEPAHDAAQNSITLTTEFTAHINQDDGTFARNSHDFHVHHPWAKQGV
ncbi:hypothetical protein F4861DRAFT_508164 [Xylaria intraflava]|nr:hypothetical protein F4861DRAFT_508164 [Xylaria intraflava]